MCSKVKLVSPVLETNALLPQWMHGTDHPPDELEASLSVATSLSTSSDLFIVGEPAKL